MNEQRQQLLQSLEHDFETGANFVRIHAAEVLCEHGYGHRIAAALQPEVETTKPSWRNGVWRVMARIAGDEAERQRYIERIRRVMLDESAPDRAGAAESLAKLGVADRADRAPLQRWLATADAATAVFPLWLSLLSSTEAERPADEAHLAGYLESSDEIARLRAGFALGRMASLLPETAGRLSHRAESEPGDSQARAYLLAAAFLQAPRESPAATAVKARLLPYIETGNANEQLEVGTVLGLRGTEADLPALRRLLASPEADGRIAAAGALLHLLR